MVRVTKPEGKMIIVDYALFRNSLARRFFYSLVRSYEGKYYSQFINFGLDSSLRKHGISVEKEALIALGNVRLLKGKNQNEILEA
jgi:hypothetical protein